MENSKIPPEVLEETIKKIKIAIVQVDYGELVIKIDNGIPQYIETHTKKRIKAV